MNVRTTTWAIAVGPHLAGALLLAAYGIQADAPHPQPILHAPARPHVLAAHHSRPLHEETPRQSRPARTLTMHLEHGEHVPDGRPNTWVHIPSSLDASPDLRLTFLFHGFKNCIESYTSAGIVCSTKNNVMRPGYRIAAQLEREGSKSIVVIPETSFDVMSAEAPELSKQGAFRAYVEELLAAISADTGGARLEDVHRLALAASSGGYQALEPILADSGPLVTDVILMDAAYMYPKSAVGRFLGLAVNELASGTPRHRIGILYTPSGGALATTEELLHLTMSGLEAAGALDRARFKRFESDPAFDDLTAPLYIHRVHEDHDVVVRRNLGRVIAAAGL